MREYFNNSCWMWFKWPACYFWCVKKDSYKAEWQLCLRDDVEYVGFVALQQIVKRKIMD